MSKLKVGDKVRVVSDKGRIHHNFAIGALVRVQRVDDDDTILCAEERPGQDPFDQWVDVRDVAPVQSKIVVTTDGVTTTARLFSGKELVKSATAKLSHSDEFDFKIGAGIAVSRLLNTEEKEPEPEVPKFTRADLRDGMFCRLSDGSWFVIVGDLAVCDDGDFIHISDLRDDLTWENAGSIEVVLEGVSCFNEARLIRRSNRRVKYVRPGAKFE